MKIEITATFTVEVSDADNADMTTKEVVRYEEDMFRQNVLKSGIFPVVGEADITAKIV